MYEAGRRASVGAMSTVGTQRQPSSPASAVGAVAVVPRNGATLRLRPLAAAETAARASRARRSPTRVLIAGGGVAALEAALALRDLAEERVAVELLAPEPEFFYRPLATIEPFVRGRVRGLELAELARACGAAFTLDALASVDTATRLAITAAGARIDYDVLLVASGARPVRAVDGAWTFRGPADTDAFSGLLSRLEAGVARRLVFAVPGGVAWTLPLYELALETRSHLDAHGRERVELTLVTPEDAPLALFGAEASSAVAALLAERRIVVRTSSYPVSFVDGQLALAPTGRIDADCVVAAPRLEGVPIAGIAHDSRGFVPTDGNGRVQGVDHVFAAGDVTAFPVKQGGLAAQQADAAAETIAAAAGAPVEPKAFEPVLRGLLLTGGAPAYLRAELAAGAGGPSVAHPSPLWWPPGKIVGRYLSPFLAERAGAVIAMPAAGEGVQVEVDLAPSGAASEP